MAVPSEPGPDTVSVVQEIAALTGASCPGAQVRVGYLRGEPSLAAALAGPAVAVVPLLTHPDREVEAEVRRVVSEATGSGEAAGEGQEAGSGGLSAVVAEPLGPHPLLAEMLHERLADAGLARADRVRQLSIAGSGADGIVIAVTGGREGVEAASMTAVLLAARLAVQVLPAAVGKAPGAQSVEDAIGRLRADGAKQPAVVPCVVGIGSEAEDVAAAAERAGAPCAAPLGPHHRVADLVAFRYREAIGLPGADPALMPREPTSQ
jgi:sirohydrochlorin ferrochelatase